MASNWGPFLSYWGSYCKDTLYTQVVRGEQSIHFSEGLLKTLCYETDVGPIPRGIKLDTSGEKPKYFHSENWNKKIQGCYWCVDDNTNIAGVCCNRDCFYYFHDWCVERVHHFTKRPFCRLPGCELFAISDSLYCSKTHEGKFDAAFPKGSNYNTLFKTVIREGPTWYRSDDKISHDSPSKSTDNRQSCPVTQSNTVHTNTTHPHSKKDKNAKKDKNQAKGTSTQVTPIMDFPTELHSAMIFKTDIGIIPRSPPREHHLTSPYSSSPNWLRDIRGCYWCGNKSDMVDDSFCRYRCYLIFYEWCIRKVHTFTGVKMCRDTGCNKTAADGFDCCNREHTKAIEGKYSSVRKVDLDRVCNAVGPNFYKKCDAPNIDITTTKHNHTQSQQKVTSTPVPQQVISPKHCSPPIPPDCFFSWNLTQFLFHSTDVGAIPRILMNTFPPKDIIPNKNWSIQLDSCYWCYSCPPRLQGVICSDRCLFLLNEWVHSTYTSITNEKLCRVLRCGNKSAYGFDCCNRDHSVRYESFKKYSYLLKHTEFALGPVWYHDYRTVPVNFYNRDEPFYELTNFFPCQSLIIDDSFWPTTEHYFQANKFVGTPYFHRIRQLQAPRDAFGFSRNPGVQRWIRTNWQTIKIDVMLKALRYKFSLGSDLAQILIRTRNRPIFEHTKNDKFWGDGGDGKGLNMLGQLLMDVRAKLQNTQQLVPNTMQPMQMQNSDHYTYNQNYGNNISDYSPPPIPFPQTLSNNQNVGPTNAPNLKNTPLIDSTCTGNEHPEKNTSTPATPANNPTDLIDLNDTNSKYLSTNPFTITQNINTNLPQTLIQDTQPNSETRKPSFIIGVAKHPLQPDYKCPYENIDSTQSTFNSNTGIITPDSASDKSETSHVIDPFSGFVDLSTPETTFSVLPEQSTTNNSHTTQVADGLGISLRPEKKGGNTNPFSESLEHPSMDNSHTTQAADGLGDSLRPEKKGGNTNPFSEFLEHSSTDNSHTVNDVTMRDDDTSKLFCSTSLKADPRLFVANTVGTTTSENNTASNDRYEPMDST